MALDTLGYAKKLQEAGVPSQQAEAQDIDTVILTGGSTSGCVRATVVDSLSHGYRTIVPEECVADKHESPHFANLYDIAIKYGDVVPVADVIEYLEDYSPAND